MRLFLHEFWLYEGTCHTNMQCARSQESSCVCLSVVSHKRYYIAQKALDELGEVVLYTRTHRQSFHKVVKASLLVLIMGSVSTIQQPLKWCQETGPGASQTDKYEGTMAV